MLKPKRKSSSREWVTRGVCYNATMNKRTPKTQISSQAPAQTSKTFSGLERVDIKVLKLGSLDLNQEIQRLRKK